MGWLPANAYWRYVITKVYLFLCHPHGLQLFLSEGSELPTTATAWRKASLSPSGRLEGHKWLLAARQRQFK